MGIEFRGKGYNRRVRIGKRTVKEGEACAVWDQYGKHTEVVGPSLVRLWWSTIRFLELHVAGADDYLRVRNRDGTVEHRRGPVTLFENPVYHFEVTVEQAISLPDGSSHLVVQREEADAAADGGAQRADRGVVGATRRIVTGPILFFPEPADLVHRFNWADGGAGTLSDDGRVLHLQRTFVRKIACKAWDANGHVMMVGVELRARLVGVEQALAVPDPMGACDALVKSRVLEALEGSRFVDQVMSLLATARTALTSTAFTQALAAAMRERAACQLVGLAVSGAKPSTELEKILRKEDEFAAANVQEQLAAMALDASMERQEREQKLEAVRQAHQLELAASRESAAQAHKDAEDQRRLAYFRHLKALNVDLTEYLCTTLKPGSSQEIVEIPRKGSRHHRRDMTDEQSDVACWGC
mmetsp:Transcript_60406/g.168792  ORF Transcript_60406/g.168792 Transcript_60406/m.168792 type:complete len:413 (-) Transcript_60406:82-1320(-)